MKLRKLELKDAPYMLEWMHDQEVIKYMNVPFLEKEIRDCELFILDSISDKNNLHLAIADDLDRYMGTVSLKRIDHIKKRAEFAIVLRQCAIGKGYAGFAIKEIIKIGLNDMELDHIYWYVSTENKRAIQFYKKMGYNEIKAADKVLLSEQCKNQSLKWYMVEKHME